MSADNKPQEYNYTEERFIIAKASAARTAGDLVYLTADETGMKDAALADDTTIHLLGVAQASIASGARGLYKVQGLCDVTVPSGNYTAGHGLKLLDGAIASTGATAAGIAGEASTVFAAIATGGTSVTTCSVYLYGQKITGTT